MKDWDDDEDKEILESIKYAENKMGAKMGTPKALPKEHAYAPVKYDVEDTNDLKLYQKEKKIIQGSSQEEGIMGLCEADDDECRKKSKAAPTDE